MLRQDLIAEGLDEYAEWLVRYGAHRVKMFDGRRRSDVEAAASEALIGNYLRRRVDKIDPAEDMASGGPDFRCVHKGHPFYVEVTSLKTSAIEQSIKVPDDPNWKGGFVGSISKIVRTAVSGKSAQCLLPNAPTVVAIGTHHSLLDIDTSLAEELLISDMAYEVQVSPSHPIPEEPGRFVTGLRNALFMRFRNNGVQRAREYVSAVVIFGLGYLPARAIGLVNDVARRSFDPSLLPEIQFAGTVRTEEGALTLRWFNTDG
jgi:hypothetical protein